jgi:hypothetical protein
MIKKYEYDYCLSIIIIINYIKRSKLLTYSRSEFFIFSQPKLTILIPTQE